MWLCLFVLGSYSLSLYHVAVLKIVDLYIIFNWTPETTSKTKKASSMFRIRICIVHLILVTLHWAMVIMCMFLKTMVAGCCLCGNKTSTKKYWKLTFYPNISETSSMKQYLEKHLYPKNTSKKKPYQKQLARIETDEI